MSEAADKFRRPFYRHRTGTLTKPAGPFRFSDQSVASARSAAVARRTALKFYQFLEEDLPLPDRERISRSGWCLLRADFRLLRRVRRRRFHIGDEPSSNLHPGEAVQDKGRSPPLAIRLLDRSSGGRDFLGVGARPARLCGEVLHPEDGKLGSRRQQTLAVFFIRDAIKFPDVIHSLKPDPVNLSPGAEPHLRFHEPDRRIDAHAHAPVLRARNFRPAIAPWKASA